MKKFLALLLVATLLVSLAACGSKDDERIMGVYTEDTRTYENSFIGIGCKLDAGWDVFSAEQIAELNGLLASQTDDEAIAKQLESSGTAMPFYAQKEEGLVTLNITLEDLGLLYGSLLDEKQYAEKSIDQVKPALESMGMSNVTTEIGSITFAGSDHVSISISGSLQGISFYETLVCVKTEKHMALITAGSYMTDTTKDILALFYAL